MSSYEGHLNETKEIHTKCTGLCRVILPDGSTTVVPTCQTETIKEVVTRLLDKRALRFSNYDVLVLATDEVSVTFCTSGASCKQKKTVTNFANTYRHLEIEFFFCITIFFLGRMRTLQKKTIVVTIIKFVHRILHFKFKEMCMTVTSLD